MTHIDRFLEAKQAELVSPNTLRAYRWAFGHLRCVDPDTATASDVQGVYRGLQGTGAAPDTIITLDRVLRTFFAWLNETTGAANPMASVRKPRRPKRFPRVFTDAELTAICRACRSPRDRVMIGLLLASGVRLAELASLTWDHVHHDHVTVIDGKGQKSRVVYVDHASELPFDPPTSLAQEFVDLRLRRTESPSLWNDLSYDGVENAVRAIMRRARVAGARHGAHTFRHTYATLYLRAGGSLWALQQQLGHEDIATTMLYPRMVGNDVKADVQRIRALAAIGGAT